VLIIIVNALVSTTILFLVYELGRCSAIHDICDGIECEDIDCWLERRKVTHITIGREE